MALELNDAPTTSPVTLTVSEDTHYFFSSGDFVFNDPEGDDFVSVTIESLPQNGILQFEGQAVIAGQTITSQELGKLTFKPAHNESGDNYVQFDFSVSDGELSSEIQTLTFDVLPITDGLSVSASLKASGSHISDSIIEEQLENLSKLTPSTSPTNDMDYLVTDGSYDVSSLNGDDYILSTEQPSDERLVGAEGNDVIFGGASNTQQLYGDDFGGTIAGNDILIGGDSANNVDFYAGLGDDVLIAQDKYATTAYYGSGGIDTAYVPGKLSDYNFTKGSGSASSYDFQLIPKDHDNTHQFYDVEYVVFEDGKYSVEDGELVKTHNIYDLSIDVNLHDDDGSEQLVSVIISDVPEGVEIHNASKLPNGSWSVDVSDFSSGEVTLKVESPVDINPIFTVSATAQEFEDGQWVDVPKTATAQTGSVFVSSVDPNGDNKVEGGSGDDVLVGDIGGYVNSVTPGVNYNIALVVDTSGSMGDYVRDSQGYIQLNPDNTYMTRMDMMQQALKNLVTSFASHDGVVNVSLIGFDDNIDVSFPVMDLRENSSSFYELLNKIEGNLPVGGGTDYDVGFSEANNWFGSRDILSNGYENMTLFLTDGEPYTSSVDDALAEFDKLTNTYNSEVLAIGMGSDISTDYLKFFDNTNVVSLEKVPGMESSYDVFSFSNRYNLEGQEYTTGNGDVYVSRGDLVLKADHGYAKWESSKFEISKDSSDLNFEVKMWKSDFSWELFDSNGIRVDSGQLSGSGKKDISSEGLKAGSYTLVLTHVGESGWYGSYAYLDEVSITEYVFANVGDVQIAATPDELEAALQGSETIKEIANMGSDQVFGNEGNDVLFGDTINSDFLPWGVNGNPDKPADFEDGSGLAGLKTFLELKNGTEPTDLDIYDFVKENHQIFDVEGDNRGSGDIVDGGAGDDVLYGQGGSDTLIGGVGNDILTGGEDADIFTWLDGDLDGSTDSIKGFDVAEGDKIDLSDLFADATADDVTTILNNISDSAQDTESGVSIKVENSAHEHVTIELDGLSAADITNNLDNIFIIKD
ncbi:VWA domain-containing protein [Vibrio nereis]|uniref:VWA domain-containing protein n=1 Tax=Vibrio nereis TaxID=693 RepID=UPI001B806B7E|nr:VWA domain-containing protein [Vibrio nereis]